MSEPKIGAGDISLSLNEHEIVLHPTLRAATTLSSSQGGITRMVERCLQLEFEAIYAVILAGMGGKQSKDLRELVYAKGMLDLSPICIRFLHILANGGRPLTPDEEPESDDDPLEESS